MRRASTCVDTFSPSTQVDGQPLGSVGYFSSRLVIVLLPTKLWPVSPPSHSEHGQESFWARPDVTASAPT